MASTQNYEVLAPELTVHRQVGELTDPISGTVTGIQQGRGRTVIAGTILSASEISPVLIEALEDEDHPSHEYATKRLRPVSEDSNEESYGVPIAGYDDLDEDQILAVLRVLPSAQAQAVKQYESLHDNRGAIVNFSVGFGESPEQRQTGGVSSPLDEEGRDEAQKPVTAIRTRVPEPPEGEIVEPGEGVTGTGERQIPHGTAASEEGDDSESGPGTRKKVARRGRRPRPAQSGGDEGGNAEGSGSSE